MAEAKSPMKKYWFGQKAPEMADGWFEMYQSVTKKEGALDAKTKELIMVVTGSLMRCEHCVEAHTKGALKAGATKEEIAEAIMTSSFIASATQIFWMPEMEKLMADD